MKKAFVYFLMILAMFLLQTTLFRAISLGGIVPNLLLIIVVSAGIMSGESYGLTTGFFCGLLCDIFFGSFLGFYALLYLYIGFVNGLFHRSFFAGNYVLPISLLIGSDLFYGMACYLLMFLFRSRFALAYYFMHRILPEMIYTIVAALLFYPLILRISTRLDLIERRKEKKFV